MKIVNMKDTRVLVIRMQAIQLGREGIERFVTPAPRLNHFTLTRNQGQIKRTVGLRLFIREGPIVLPTKLQKVIEILYIHEKMKLFATK